MHINPTFAIVLMCAISMVVGRQKDLIVEFRDFSYTVETPKHAVKIYADVNNVWIIWLLRIMLRTSVNLTVF